MTDIHMRVLFAALVMLISGVQYYYRRDGSAAARRRTDGTSHQVRDQVTGYAILAWVCGVSLYPLGLSWLRTDLGIPLWVRAIGFIGMAASIPLSAWTYRSLGNYFSPKLEVFRAHRVVRDGPYRFVRHPMYATLFLCMESASMASASSVVAALGGIAMIAIYLRIRKEEAMLLARFPETYRRYMATTGALFPRLLYAR